jgi:hypothetical protein
MKATPHERNAPTDSTPPLRTECLIEVNASFRIGGLTHAGRGIGIRIMETATQTTQPERRLYEVERRELSDELATEPRAHNGVIGCPKCGTDWQGPNAGKRFVEHTCTPPRTCVDCGETFRGPNADWLVIQAKHFCSALEEYR